jgi:hypothetical protein
MKYLVLLAIYIYENVKNFTFHRLNYFYQNLIYTNQLIKDYHGIIFFDFTKHLKLNTNKKIGECKC